MNSLIIFALFISYFMSLPAGPVSYIPSVFFTATICYLVYWFGAERLKSAKGIFAGGTGFNTFAAGKTLGFLCLGLVPLLVAKFSGINPLDIAFFQNDTDGNAVVWICIGSAIVVLINAAIGRSSMLQSKHPEDSRGEWTISAFAAYHFFWLIYLAAYEFLFRGLLFFPLVQLLGPEQAIAINVCVYSFAHLPQGAAETFGSMLFGSFFCMAALSAGSVLPAIIIHFAFALSGNFFAVFYHRDKKFAI